MADPVETNSGIYMDPDLKHVPQLVELKNKIDSGLHFEVYPVELLSLLNLIYTASQLKITEMDRKLKSLQMQMGSLASKVGNVASETLTDEQLEAIANQRGYEMLPSDESLGLGPSD